MRKLLSYPTAHSSNPTHLQFFTKGHQETFFQSFFFFPLYAFQTLPSPSPLPIHLGPCVSPHGWSTLGCLYPMITAVQSGYTHVNFWISDVWWWAGSRLGDVARRARARRAAGLQMLPQVTLCALLPPGAVLAGSWGGFSQLFGGFRHRSACPCPLLELRQQQL